MTKFNVTRFGLALGVAAAIALSAPARAGDMVKCGKTIENKTSGLQNALLKTLYWCRDAMKKGPMDVKLASKINGKLAGVYGPGKSVDKYRAAIDLLYPGTCSDTDLRSLGFMLSIGPAPLTPLGPAPGATGIKFTEDYLIVQSESNAYSMMLSEAPLFSNDLQQLQQLGNCPTITYPYLCNLKPECMERVCGLGIKPAEGGTSTSGTKTYSWALGSAPYNCPPSSPAEDHLADADPITMCFMDGDLQYSTTTTEPGVVYLVSPVKTRSLEIVDLGSPIYVCVDTLRSAGFCDCSGGHAGRKNITDCQDRDSLKTCLGVPPGPLSTGNDACGSPCSAQQADPSYPGDYNGLPNVTADTDTVTGDCVQQLTNQFTVLTSNHMYGPDGAPCTSDDIGGVNSPTSVVLTTGHSFSTLKNAVVNYGKCRADDSIVCVNTCQNRCLNHYCELESPPLGCSIDSDCDHTCDKTCLSGANDGLVCEGPAAVLCPGGACIMYDTNISVDSPGITGSKPLITGGDPPQYGTTFCQRYQQNHLKGMSLAGTFPGSSSGQGGGLGDNLNVFHMDCK